MADVTGPLGGDSGGKDLEAAAKKALAKAEAEAQGAEKAAADAEAGQRKASGRVRSAGQRIERAAKLSRDEIASIEAKIAKYNDRQNAGGRVAYTDSPSKREWRNRPASKISPTSQRYLTEFEAALKTPGFNFTPASTLARDSPLVPILQRQGVKLGAEPEKAANERVGRAVRRKAKATADAAVAVEKQAAAAETEADFAKRQAARQADYRRVFAEQRGVVAGLDPNTYRDSRKIDDAKKRVLAAERRAAITAEDEAKARDLAGSLSPSMAAGLRSQTQEQYVGGARAGTRRALQARGLTDDRGQATSLGHATAEALDRVNERVAATVEQTEQKQTTAVQKGTQKRATARKAEADVTKAVGGDLNEFNRILAGREEELQRQAQAADQYAARAAAGSAPKPGDPAFKAEVARQEAQLAAQAQVRGQALIPHPTARLHGPLDDPAARQAYAQRDVERYAPGYAPGTRSPLEAADREVARTRIAAAASQKDLQAATRRAAGATAAEADAAAKEVEDLNRKHVANKAAAAAAVENAAGIRRENATRFAAAQPEPYRPGTDIVPHPQLFGQRVPGPFGQVFGPREPTDIEKQRSSRQIARDPRQKGPSDAAAAIYKQESTAANAAAIADERHARNVDIVARSDAQAGSAEAALTNAIRFHSAALGGLDGDMRRHGALTTEFIQSAARGEASYKEWGFQIGATAAKFGAWTLVSIPVIAALTAVRSLGQGAIASASGVDVLKRSLDSVDPHKAQESFRSLSGQFNVPISDVVDAVYRSSQVFHQQADAVDAARAALYSYRVGEVSVEDSTRYLNAIATGAGLTGAGGGQRILDLFNQINQAQNRFGISIRGTEAGMARAAGAFTNAGGSLSYLLALITTGSRVTGRTGENIGTAIQRSVGFIQRPSNRAKLREFGIDPSQGVQSTYEQAFTAAQQLHGPRLQQLATALSSPQYASYLVPLLQNRQLFRQVQAETSPQASQNSAKNELGHVLDQVDEKIKRLTTGLGQLGSNLAESGLLNIFGAFLGTLNASLAVVNRILDVFNQLPDSVKNTLSLLLEGRLVLAGIRRANLGEALVGGRADKLAPFFVENTDSRNRRLVGKGVRAAAGTIEDRAITAQATALDSALKAKAAVVAKQAEFEQLDRQLAAGYITEEELAQLKADAAEKEAVAIARSQAASRAADATLLESSTARDLEASFQREVVKGRVSATDWAQRNGVYTPPVLGNPLTIDPRMREHLAAGGDPVLTGNQLALFGDDTRREPARLTTTSVAGSQAAKSIKAEAAALNDVRNGFGKMAAASVAMSSGIDAVKTGWQRATVQTEEIALSARAAAASMLAAFGPQAILLGLLIGVPKVLEARKKAADAQNARRNLVQGQTPGGDPLEPHTRAAVERQRKQLEDAAQHHDSFLNKVDNFLTQPIFGGTPPSDQNQFKSPAERQLAVLNDRNRRQQQAIRTGKPVPELTYEGLRTRLDRDFDEFDQGQITLKQLRDRQAKRMAEIRSSLVTPQTAGVLRSRYQAQLLQREDGRRPIADQLTAGGLSGVSSSVIDDTSSGLDALLQANVASDSQRSKFLELQLVKAARSLHATGPVGQKRYAEASQAITQTLQNVGKAELDRALAVATTQTQRDAAYDKYQNTLTRAGTIAQRALLASLRRQQQQARVRNRAATGPSATLIQGTLPPASNPISDLLGGLGSLSLQAQLGALTAQAPQLFARINKEKVAITDRAKAIRRIQKALDDAMAPIRAEINAMRAQADKSNGDDAIQQQASLIQARAQLAAARAGSEVGSQQAQIGGLGQLLAFQQAHRGVYHEADIVGTEAQLADAQHQLGLTMQQQARDLIAAQGEYRKSLTDNPLAQARIDAATAQRQLAYGHFDTPAARLQAQAERNRTRRDAYKATSDRQIENLDLEHDIGRLSDQAFISALQRIYRTTKAGSEYKRQLRARILRLQHDIQNDTSLDINVGDLRLPTIYDVRRLGRQGLNTAPAQLQHNEFHFSVRNDSDVERLGGELHSILGANTVGAMRAAGLR